MTINVDNTEPVHEVVNRQHVFNNQALMGMTISVDNTEPAPEKTVSAMGKISRLSQRDRPGKKAPKYALILI